MAKIRTHYDNLKIARNAPDAVVRASYKALMQTYHPDKFDGAKQQEATRITKIIRESYEVLIDPIRRSVHDRWIEEQEGQAQQSQFEDIKTGEPEITKPSNVPAAPAENKTSNLWLVCLIIACLAIIIYGSLYPSPETQQNLLRPIVWLGGYNLPVGVVFWLIFFIICGLKQGKKKAAISFAAIYGSLLGIALIDHSQYHYQETGVMAAPVSVPAPSSRLIANRYRDNSDGTVKDLITGLEWMRCSWGQTSISLTCRGEPTRYNWRDTLAIGKEHLNFASHNDWRVPTIDELNTLVYCSSGQPKTWNNIGDSCKGDNETPTVVSEAFPYTHPHSYWSSTPFEDSNYGAWAWVVNFHYGHPDPVNQQEYHAVRLVR